MILDTVSYLDGDYHLILSKTSDYRIKLRIVKTKRGERYKISGPDKKTSKVLREEYMSANPKYKIELENKIEEMKETLSQIVLEEAWNVNKATDVIINKINKGEAC